MYAVYYKENGRIVLVASNATLEEIVATAENTGDRWMFHDSFVDSDSYYVRNGVLVEIPAQPSFNHRFNYLAGEWEDVRDLDQLKRDKWQEIKKARDAHEFGGFTWGAYLFDSDQLSQQRIGQAAQAALFSQSTDQAYHQDWTLANNTVVSLSAQDMLDVALAMGTHIGNAHTRARELREMVFATNSAEELNQLTW